MRFKGTFNFVHSSKYFFIFSIIITILGAAALGIFGLNYGVDFSSGTNVDVTLTKQIEKKQVEDLLKSYDFKKEPVITTGAERMTIRFSEVLTEPQEKQFKADFSKIDSGASFEINTVDVEIARELQRNALLAVGIASLGIIIYVSIRFEWRFAVSAVIALLHDAFMVISLFSIFRLEVNLPFIIAILTIIGYSINDTIVIFDRIRENLRFAKVKNIHDLAHLVNDSIYQTLTRSINTVLTVLVAALCLFIFGSESIRMFSLAILFGLGFGAYSSIFIASPLWVVLKSKEKKKPKATAKTQQAQ
ncbi:protein translocase subunit SecF [Paenibacillus apiarius]|uniref:Protein-export membrane protein SecF n=1 Tax=Paenibacillus apiarius TaxID=46240 RepID=A0ABT4DXC1_9BACL|nr:protein translocase subunit SecF [Paenibacillus apiarius]MCY9512934.1 protein translocase subunit SecF [Paenibacillus apiarius]MCY9522017.1 protein translocase subunit SecF [Paenibacillus apiarius]MCY9555062.1 protein translocase subunit SecF [Paenibacillus apiarius]MCY9558082.1 protein translocase subunit SecF [Paenibacillus apiarius]MCY9686754.1 protein translocase subunit SecF [Paenibacillus apiarius]